VSRVRMCMEMLVEAVSVMAFVWLQMFLRKIRKGSKINKGSLGHILQKISWAPHNCNLMQS